MTINNEEISSVKTEEEFRDFLGTIDNLEEAILLARTYGYILDDNIRGSEYKNLQNGFELHLMKFHEFTIRKEYVEIKISKDGFIKTKSCGKYCEDPNRRWQSTMWYNIGCIASRSFRFFDLIQNRIYVLKKVFEPIKMIKFINLKNF